ncbi:VanW family protein [Egicoccus halophilus]|uniref:Vanomycin resistance protein VanB n=1 Tax=Egicoccus halophilus TaxID=1670830 RepID=A0A8J3EX43_9ACTN|nr:VanW family protein [Egicoccus halophilus]GGI05025.1 vanomycin resistance protein VanB [Egicoccus halophilus]
MAERNLPVVVGAVVGAVVGLVLLVLGGLWLAQGGEILPNTTVAGVELGGLAPEEATGELQDVVEQRRRDTVTLAFEDRQFVVAPADVGFEVDVAATVAAAASRGRDGLPGDALERVRSLWTEREYPLRERHDEQALAARVDEIATEVDREEFPGDVVADPDTLEVSVEPAQGRASVRRDELTTVLTEAMLEAGPDELDLPVDTTPQPVADEDLEQVATQVEGAVAAPLILEAAGEQLTLEPGTIARLIEVTPQPDGDDGAPSTLAIEVTPQRLEEVLGDTVDRFDTPPQDASFVTDRAPPSRFDPQGSTSFSPVEVSVDVAGGQPGSRFDPEAAADQLEQLFADNVREAELEVEVVDPDLDTARAEELRPTHVIGTFTTYYTGGQPRVQNIQRLADVVDDTLVLPDEQFSINELSGERRCERGYVEAGTIVQGELVDTCGGGVSQFGTTTFNAAFFAGVQLDQWQAHSFYISRYPMGREATLSYPTLDVRFTNDTDGAIVVRTSYTSGAITVTLYGQPVAETVRAQHGSPTDRVAPETQTRTVDDLACGQEREIQGQNEGFTVEVVRTVERIGGGSDQQTIRTVYSPQNRIVERGAC